MNGDTLIQTLTARGVVLSERGGRLRAEGPAAALSDDLRAVLADRKGYDYLEVRELLEGLAFAAHVAIRGGEEHSHAVKRKARHEARDLPVIKE
jgi:DNA-binding FadR family transcriptional regulator